MRSLTTDSSRRRCEIERGAGAPSCPDHRHLTDGSDTLAIRNCLADPDAERWYGDGPPHWRQGRGNRPAMTSDEARAQRGRDVKMLRRHGKGDPQALDLADDIAACRPGRRCGRAGCTECKRATQRLFVDASDHLLRRSSINVLAVSVVLRGAGAFEGDLALEPDVFGRLSRQIARALRAAGIRQALGGFDVSANEHDAGRFDPHYRPHAYLFVPASQFARGEAVFREFFPVSEAVRRPVEVNDFDGYRGGLAYALKTEFQRRVTLPRVTLPGGEVKRRNTRDRPLRACQKLELALALDRVGLGARIFLHGLRMVWTDGGIRFVRRAPDAAPRREQASAATSNATRGWGAFGARVARSPARRNPRTAALEPISRGRRKLTPPSTKGD